MAITTDAAALKAINLLEANQNTHLTYEREIRDIRDLDSLSFEVAAPKGSRYLESGLIRQLTDKVMQRMRKPTATLHSADAPKEVATAMRDAIQYIHEEGGLNEVYTSKPSAFRHSLNYGDGVIRVGTGDDDFPIKFDNVTPGSVYVDPNATVMRSKRGVRSVNKIMVVYRYHKDQVEADFPNVDFVVGALPRTILELKDFDKDYMQDSDAKETEVEVGYYYEIGKKPTFTILIGKTAVVAEKKEGNDYPFKSKNDKPFVPLDTFRCFEANEGFFNKGLGHIFYKYAIARRRLLNKLFGQGINSLSDIKIINAEKGSQNAFISKIDKAMKMQAQGKQGVIINDSREPVTVTAIEAAQLNQGLQTIYEELDREIKRWGLNLDSIGQLASTTATQIVSESEAEDQFVVNLMDKNTDFFKWTYESVIDMLRLVIDKDDDTPIPTNVEIEKELPEDELKELPEDEKMEKVELTMGEVSQWARKYTFRVEMDTKSGVIPKDSLRTARANLLGQAAGQLPGVAEHVAKEIADANSIVLDEKVLQQAKQEAQAGALPTAKGPAQGSPAAEIGQVNGLL